MIKNRKFSHNYPVYLGFQKEILCNFFGKICSTKRFTFSDALDFVLTSEKVEDFKQNCVYFNVIYQRNVFNDLISLLEPWKKT